MNKEPTIMVNILSPKMLCKQCVEKFWHELLDFFAGKSRMF